MARSVRALGFAAAALLIGSGAEGRTLQAQSAAGTFAAAQVQQYVSRLRAEAGLSADSAFTKGVSVSVGDRFCQRLAQTLDKRPILGSWVLVCFTPSAQAEEQASSVCDGECLKWRVPTARKFGEIRSDVEDAIRLALEREHDALRMRRNPFGQVVDRDVKPVWIQDRDRKGVRGGYLVAYETIEPVGRFVAYVDGVTGQLVAYENRIWSATARAEVYERDRFTTPDLREVKLRDLLKVQKLQSAYFEIRNDDAEPVSSGQGDYVFGPEDARFNEPQAYYGMQRALESYIAWGYQPFGSIPVIVNFGDNYANAFYDGTKIALGAGDGTKLFDTARDNTVGTHEYGHAIIDHTANPLMVAWFGDGPAIHEGHADYFACAVYNRPTLGEGVIPGGHPMRRCDTDLPFGQRKGEPHDGGRVWSGALWEVRGKLGADVTDAMAMDLLMRVKPTGFLGTTLMEDMGRALLASDAALFRGRYREIIRAVLTRRGFTGEGEQARDWIAAR